MRLPSARVLGWVGLAGCGTLALVWALGQVISTPVNFSGSRDSAPLAGTPPLAAPSFTMGPGGRRYWNDPSIPPEILKKAYPPDPDLPPSARPQPRTQLSPPVADVQRMRAEGTVAY